MNIEPVVGRTPFSPSTVLSISRSSAISRKNEALDTGSSRSKGCMSETGRCLVARVVFYNNQPKGIALIMKRLIVT